MSPSQFTGEYLNVACSNYSGTWFESTEIDKHGQLEFTISSHS
jgi:hypothetical protein